MALTTKAFEKQLRKLPSEVQEFFRDAIEHPQRKSNRLKKLRNARRLESGSWSIRVTNQEWRAIAHKVRGKYEWYWAGTHASYNSMVGSK